MDAGESKRLFFGFSVRAPWPDTYPSGRILEEDSRHLTLAFLGDVPYAPLEKGLDNLPLPPFEVGPVGRSTRLEFLPKYQPRVVAEHVEWLSNGDGIDSYHTKLLDYLASLGYRVDRRSALPHITIARSPFVEKEWEEAFAPLPLYASGISLYESVGNLRYLPLFHLPLKAPFEEFEHTADIAFTVRGNDFKELYLHGATALSFHYPPFLSYLGNQPIKSLDDVVRALNWMISSCDLEQGCPFKAVSYHGKLIEKPLLEWEMVVDV